MRFISHLIATVAPLLHSALAHMQLHHPPPFNATNNPHRTTPPDPYLQYPYNCCGPISHWTYPCRGYLPLLSTPDGRPTTTWTAGHTATFSLAGIGNHYGGSCQVGFSVDGGRTFRVATSFEGNCPRRNGGGGPKGQGFEFVVPSDLEEGVGVFAWVWYNREREFNTNCAAVKITKPRADEHEDPQYHDLHTHTRNMSALSAGSGTHNHEIGHPGGGSKFLRRPVRFAERPEMFIARDGDDCLTPHTVAELKYPEPGPEVVKGDGEYPLELPRGGCT